MSWISKLRDGLSITKGTSGKVDTQNQRRTRNNRMTPRSGKAAGYNPAKRSYPFRAVFIDNSDGCCDAAKRNTHQKFLAAHAPQLPLGTCDRPQHCRCRYKHLTDRRQDMRRDEDHGLPGLPYYGENRRFRANRRRREPLSA